MQFLPHIINNQESLPESDAQETSKTTTSPFSFSIVSAPVDVPVEQDAPALDSYLAPSTMAKLMKTLAVCTTNPFNDVSFDDTPDDVPALVAANVNRFDFLSMSIQEIRLLLS